MAPKGEIQALLQSNIYTQDDKHDLATVCGSVRNVAVVRYKSDVINSKDTFSSLSVLSKRAHTRVLVLNVPANDNNNVCPRAFAGP